ncbi:MAG: hypothetical protein WAZ98_04680 [Cyclobacteriaceae bacterium]
MLQLNSVPGRNINALFIIGLVIPSCFQVFQQLPSPNTFRNIDAIRLFVIQSLDFRRKE